MSKYKWKESNPRCAGMMTEANYRAMIKNCLRSLHRTWGGANQAKLDSRDGSKVVNPKTGRECIAHICAHCDTKLMDKEVEVDHIEPFVPISMTWEYMMRYSTLVQVADRLFCEPDGYEVLCKDCHYCKTQVENEMRRLAK